MCFKLFAVLNICINNIYFVLFHADGDRPLIIGFAALGVIVVILIIVAAVVISKLRRWVYGPSAYIPIRDMTKKLNPWK